MKDLSKLTDRQIIERTYYNSRVTLTFIIIIAVALCLALLTFWMIIRY